MGNNCCAARDHQSNFDKNQKNYINQLFNTISENNENTKRKGIIDPAGFEEYMYETDYVRKILTDELFGKDQFISYERFCNFCANLIFSDPNSKMYYLEQIIEWKIKLVNSKIRGDQWRYTRTTQQQLQQFMKYFSLFEQIQKDGLEEKKTWDEVLYFFYNKYPLVNDILKNYYEYKFLRKPMQFGFPNLQIKQTIVFDHNIASAISLTNDTLFSKITTFNRVFTSGELCFDYNTFQKSIEEFEGGILILLKFLGKEIPGTHHQYVVGVYVPEGFSKVNNTEGVLGSSDITLYEISPHFQPIYSQESIQRRNNRGRLNGSSSKKDADGCKGYVNYSGEGLGFGYDVKSEKHRIWIDKNMFQNSYILSKDDFFEQGSQVFENHILIHIEAWGILKDIPRHSQNIIEMAEHNYRSFIKYKNYDSLHFNPQYKVNKFSQQIMMHPAILILIDFIMMLYLLLKQGINLKYYNLHTSFQSLRSFFLSLISMIFTIYIILNKTFAFIKKRNTNYLDSNGGSYINHQPQHQPQRGSEKVNEEEKVKRQRQFLGSIGQKNLNSSQLQRQTVSHQASYSLDRLEKLYKKYLDNPQQEQQNKSEYDKIVNRYEQNENQNQILIVPESNYKYTIKSSQSSLQNIQ